MLFVFPGTNFENPTSWKSTTTNTVPCVFAAECIVQCIAPGFCGDNLHNTCTSSMFVVLGSAVKMSIFGLSGLQSLVLMLWWKTVPETLNSCCCSCCSKTNTHLTLISIFSYHCLLPVASFNTILYIIDSCYYF